MTKTDFLYDRDVIEFIEWLADTSKGDFPDISAGHTSGEEPFSIRNFPICLNIKKSRFVPKGVKVRVNGIENVLSHYMWKSAGMAKGDWPETKTRLTALSVALRAAVGSKSNGATLNACRDILKWGGNRNWKVGAYPFLHGMDAAGTLWQYITATGTSFSLATAHESSLTPPVSLMNAMLTKVHALYASDGLPIYDSRVAAAIASLVEMWRVDTGKSGTPLPQVLAFPATMPSRTVLRLFPYADHPGVMAYGKPGTIAQIAQIAQWSSAKVRLGWVMESVLKRLPGLFSGCCKAPCLTDRMHAFEASLFMIGYDVTCLDCKLWGEPPSEYKKKFKSLTPPLSSAGTHKTIKTITTLSGRGCQISYSGNVETGFDVEWGELRFRLDPEFLLNVENEFVGRSGVPLGASMTGTVPVDSLGKWIVDEGWASPRYASAISAILSAEGIISSFGKIGHGIVLHFSEEQ
jgi:hypothetical protein